MLAARVLVLASAVAAPTLTAAPVFEPPQKLQAAGKVVDTEEPGYASPCLADIDGDNVPELLVGQFNGGKIGVHKGSRSEDGKLSFGARTWLQAGGADAEIPGVW